MPFATAFVIIFFRWLFFFSAPFRQAITADATPYAAIGFHIDIVTITFISFAGHYTCHISLTLILLSPLSLLVILLVLYWLLMPLYTPLALFGCFIYIDTHTITLLPLIAAFTLHITPFRHWYYWLLIILPPLRQLSLRRHAGWYWLLPLFRWYLLRLLLFASCHWHADDDARQHITLMIRWLIRRHSCRCHWPGWYWWYNIDATDELAQIIHWWLLHMPRYITPLLSFHAIAAFAIAVFEAAITLPFRH